MYDLLAPCSEGLLAPCSEGLLAPCSEGLLAPCSEGLLAPCSEGEKHDKVCVTVSSVNSLPTEMMDHDNTSSDKVADSVTPPTSPPTFSQSGLKRHISFRSVHYT